MNTEKALEAARNPDRLVALYQLDLLDTENEPAFDRLTTLAATISNCPISLISLVDADRQFFKSQIGLPAHVAQARQTPLSHSFCKHVVEEDRPLIVEDARVHPVLQHNLAVADLGVIAYLGVPLSTSDGTGLGSFCVIDNVPRKWSEKEIMVLQELAHSTLREIELRAEIRAREAAEQRLRARELQTRMIVNTAIDAIIIIDDLGSVREWNPQAEKLFGWRRSEIRGRALTGLIEHSCFRDLQLLKSPACFRGAETEEPGHLEVTCTHRDGHTFPAEMSVSLLTHADRTEYSIFVRDITLRNAAAADLKIAKERAEQAAVAKSNFLANMSHEIRTPLNSVIGLAVLLQETELAPEQFSYVETIARSGRVLLDTINNILDYSKLEAGKMELDLQTFSLPQLLQNTCNMFTAEAGRKNLRLNWELAPDVPTLLKGDQSCLRRILINLVGNGIKFTESGSVLIQVTGVETGQDLFDIQFRVADTGVGMPQALIPQLFEAFSQGDPTASRNYGGTGLGLAICRELVQIMNGRIWVESALGKGSAFTFTVPIAAGYADSLAAPEKPPGAAVAATAARPLHILVAEDNAVNQMVVLHMLKRLGYEADVVANGSAALDALRSRTYDIVLMDVQMPGMDGLEATRLIRAEWPGAAGPYIVAITANALPGDRERFLAVGMDDYLSKPVVPEMLGAALERYLAQKA